MSLQAAFTDHRDARIAELEGEVAELREMLGFDAREDIAQAFRAHFRVYPQAARLLASLYSAKGRLRPLHVLDDAIPRKDGADRDNLKIVSVLIYKLREVLGRDAIENISGSGYRLTAYGQARCDEALGRGRSI